MPNEPPRLDRLLETCYKQRAAEIYIVAGQAPHLQVKGQWRSLAIHDFSETDVRRLIDEMVAASDDLTAREKAAGDFAPGGAGAGFDFGYGNVARFVARAWRVDDGRLVLRLQCTAGGPTVMP